MGLTWCKDCEVEETIAKLRSQVQQRQVTSECSASIWSIIRQLIVKEKKSKFAIGKVKGKDLNPTTTILRVMLETYK